MTASRPTDPASQVLGYLNFSSGSFDPTAWRALNDLFAAVETLPGKDGAAVTERPDAVGVVADVLRHRLGELDRPRGVMLPPRSAMTAPPERRV